MPLCRCSPFWAPLSGPKKQYLLARAGETGRWAASVDLRDSGVRLRYPKQLDRMFFRAISRAKAFFPVSADVRADSMSWGQSVVGPTQRPILELNRFCLKNGYNCMCFCRSSIIRFNHCKSGREVHIIVVLPLGDRVGYPPEITYATGRYA